MLMKTVETIELIDLISLVAGCDECRRREALAFLREQEEEPQGDFDFHFAGRHFHVINNFNEEEDEENKIVYKKRK